MENQNYYVQEEPKSGLSVTSFVLSLIALLICDPLCLVSATALILGIVALSKKQSKGFAIAGIVIAAIDLVSEIILCIPTVGITCLF